MTLIDRIAVFLSLISILAAALIAGLVFENMAHLEDEFAYVWQAEVIAHGDLTIPSPEYASSFLVPFVVDFQGERFGKYPLGWPVMLSLGSRFDVRDWVNPILTGIAVWLNYLLGKRLFSKKIGLLSAGLLLSSPLFLIHAGSLLSHMWSLVLTTSFTLFWFDIFNGNDKSGYLIKVITAGFCLGVLGLTRPLTMVAIAIPFGIHGILLIIKGDKQQRGKVFLLGGIAFCLIGLNFIWQYALTGSYTTNPYTLWWPYDKVGFGPGYGVTDQGHTIIQGWRNTKHSLRAGLGDLFGWGRFSWIFLPFGLIAARKARSTPVFVGLFLSLVGLYMAYWVGSWLYGPRYYFEALSGLTILTAVGIFWIAGCQHNQKEDKNLWRRIQRRFIVVVTLILVFTNIYFYVPVRMQGLKGLYTIERSDLSLFESAESESLTPALIIVHAKQWMSYGSLLELESPDLESPFIFAWSIGPITDLNLKNYYSSDRDVYHYYPDLEPNELFTTPALGYLHD
jgi:hypothetical protein